MRCSLFVLLACLLYAGQCVADGPRRLQVQEAVVGKANEVGARRVLIITQAGGPTIIEALQKYDAQAMTYQYQLTKAPLEVLPVTTYSSFLSVQDHGDGTSTVHWRGGFYRGHTSANPPAAQNDEAALKAVTGSYRAGLAHIKELAEK